MEITDIAFLAGRIILGGYFAFTGTHHLLNLTKAAGYAKSRGGPLPKVAVFFASPLIVFGGLGIMLDQYINLSFLALIIFIIPVTFMMHAFWRESETAARRTHRVEFLKNMALLGALLILFSYSFV